MTRTSLLLALFLPFVVEEYGVDAFAFRKTQRSSDASVNPILYTREPINRESRGETFYQRVKRKPVTRVRDPIMRPTPLSRPTMNQAIFSRERIDVDSIGRPFLEKPKTSVFAARSEKQETEVAAITTEQLDTEGTTEKSEEEMEKKEMNFAKVDEKEDLPVSDEEESPVSKEEELPVSEEEELPVPEETMMKDFSDEESKEDKVVEMKDLPEQEANPLRRIIFS